MLDVKQCANRGLPAVAAAATFVATAATAFVATAAATAISAVTTAAATTATLAAAAVSTTAAATTVAAATTTATLTATVAAATTTAAATVTTAGFKFFWLRGIHAKRAALIVVTVECLDRSVQLALVAEGHKRESLGSACFAVGDDFDPFNRSISGEEASNVFFSSGVGQVAHVDVHFCLFLSRHHIQHFLRPWRKDQTKCVHQRFCKMNVLALSVENLVGKK
jgi:hypothetical protein